MRLAYIFMILAALASPSMADQFERAAVAGKRTLMRAYSNFNIIDCTGYAGTVSVLSHPRNGKLSQSPGPYRIEINRFTGQRSKFIARDC